jgi:hypothetical protein
MDKATRTLGLVYAGQELTPVWPEKIGGSFRLTRNSLQSALAPDTHEVSLAGLDGKWVMVGGDRKGEWIYSATIEEVAGPILSVLIEKALGG